MKSPVATAVAAFVLGLPMVVLFGAAALADGPIYGGDPDTPNVTVTVPGGDHTTGPDAEPIYQVPVPYQDYYYTPSCMGNGPPPNVVDALCNGAVSTCPEEGDIRWMVYSMWMTPEGQPQEGATWEFEGTRCRGADDPPEGGPVTITEADLKAVVEGVLPVPELQSEPGERTYVNIPTNFSTTAVDETTTVNVIGVSVQVHITSTDHTWNFGDTATATGIGIPGASLGQDGAVEHSYSHSGAYDVTVTRGYHADFTLPGGQVISQGGFTRTSAPLTLEVGEIQSLVTEVG